MDDLRRADVHFLPNSSGQPEVSVAAAGDGLLDLAQRISRQTRRLGALVWVGYAPIIALTAIYYGTASILLGKHDAEIPMELVQAFFNIKFMLLAFVLTGSMVGYAALLKKTDERPLVRVREWFARQPYLEIALLRFLPVVLLMIPLQETYSAVKINIPEIVPYSWDATFARLDRLIFMGADPWTVTHSLIPWPFATWALNIAYVIWFYILMACLAAAAMMPLDSRVRLTYLLACFLSWVVGGSVLAIIFSSAGPVYYERLFGDPIFAPLFERLSAQSEIHALISLTTQETLWHGYADPAAPAVGISAFPSMHLTIAAGMVPFVAHISRPLGWLMAAFTVVMLVGSVHLGWHYAVDGIAGIALAFFFWRLSERFAGWWLERPAIRMSSSVEVCPASGPRQSVV